MLYIYKPWIGEFDETQDMIASFNQFLQSPHCPPQVKIPYEKNKIRYQLNTLFDEVTGSVHECDNPTTKEDDPDNETNDLVQVVNTMQAQLTLEKKFDLGVNYDWSKQNYALSEDENNRVQTFLTHEIDLLTASKETDNILLPLRPDKTTYELQQLNSDQQDLVCHILSFLKRLQEANSQESIQPLRMTVAGVPGSGKSTVVNTIVTTIRKMFKSTDSVIVCGPTGCSAYNAGGSTCHKEFHLKTKGKAQEEICHTLLKKLRNKMNRLVAVIIDERSMVSARLLAQVEYRIRMGMQNGEYQDNLWGNVPLLLLVGDDYQLPAIEKGMIYSCSKERVNNVDERHGLKMFYDIGKTTFFLKHSERTLNEDSNLQRILQRSRCQPNTTHLENKDSDLLCSYHLNLQNFSQHQIDTIQNDPRTIFLFANREPKDEFNIRRLTEIHCKENPVAVIRPIVTDNNNKRKKSSHFKTDTVLNKLLLCRGAKVQLDSRNIYPQWGLYNGSLGIVRDIVYNEGESPNHGDLPKYILTEFFHYCGPPFIKDNPTYVPIVPVTKSCTNTTHCCKKSYVPLSLSFAKTVHTFQGQNVGPVQPGRPENQILRLVCDPGAKSFEGNNPGLFFTIVSRVTTMGDEYNKMTSALYFVGPNMKKSRVMNLTIGKNGKTFKKVKLRQAFVEHLQKNTVKPTFTIYQRQHLFSWAKNTTFSQQDYSNMIAKFNQK